MTCPWCHVTCDTRQHKHTNPQCVCVGVCGLVCVCVCRGGVGTTCPWCHVTCDTRTREVLTRQSRDSGDCSRKLNPSLPHMSKFVHYQGFRCFLWNCANTNHSLCISLRITISIWNEGTCGSDGKMKSKVKLSQYRYEQKCVVGKWSNQVLWSFNVIPFLGVLCKCLQMSANVCKSCLYYLWNVAKETFESLLRGLERAFQNVAANAMGRSCRCGKRSVLQCVAVCCSVVQCGKCQCKWDRL